MSPALEISVVVATYNRAAIIAQTLRHLAQQTLDAATFEVIVVDDGSSDNTAAVVKGLRESLPYRLTYLRHPNRGPGYTQNQGIRAAQAPLVVLIADDIFLTPKALEAYRDAHRRHPELQAVFLGKTMQSPALAETSQFMQKFDAFRFKFLENCTELPYYYFWACNISCKRDFLVHHGLFREQIGRAGPAAHEDVELGFRLSRQGMRLYYLKEALGYHHHMETLEGAIRRAYMRGLNWQELRDLVDDPAITVKYHILNISTLADHIKAYYNPANLMAWDANPYLLAGRELARRLAFNTATVRFFWLPLMRRADKQAWLRHLMHDQFYRGVIFYHFLKGVTDARRLYPARLRHPNT